MRTLFFSLLAVLAFGCSSDNTETVFTPQTIDPVIIGKGFVNLSHDFDDENRVIHTGAQWQELIDQMEAARGGITDNFTETTIDFSQYDVVASFTVSSSATTIDMTNVTENEDNVTVILQNLQLGLTQDVVHPFHIIKVEKTGKPFIFDDQTGR
ncbi:hypothetical protein GR160_08830 [Flavobacterium sp. Sd200]|uniref:hypothetical protein n=1 Tax=Flavobacterium sp. Sd200 TaxID=2692211 RepID=UPI0013714E38|nr:hypothetical protein [Flavobacterium sp. Sd200]MXN91332.1 hypothetical protein [Flavobacterium sp. Sd200]